MEVDKNGKDLAGYQNKECGAYRLTFDNNGEAWRFTSNYQVITVVAMTQHKKLGWPFFSIRPAELKTVLLKFKDMKDGNDGAGGDGRGGGGRGPGGGRGCADGAAAAARWKSRRVQPNPEGALDAAAVAAADHARKAAQHAVDNDDRDARLARRGAAMGAAAAAAQ